MCFIPVRLLIGAQIRSLTTRITSLLVNICRTTFVKARFRILVLPDPSGVCQAPNMYVNSATGLEVWSHEFRVSTPAENAVSFTGGVLSVVQK